ncbi:MAG: PAS domain-containing protein [Pseudomonadota bacterium]
MSIQSFPTDLADVLGVLGIIDVPAFVLTVDDQGVIRFGGLNRAHEARTGMQGKDIAGLTPHQALPPRMADTVLANYILCAQTRQTYRYEEVLDLPSGRIWWLTTLSPIVERDRTTAILGLATDVTALRTEIADITAEFGELRARADCLQTLGHAVMAETRGPLNNIISLGRMLRAEFHPPTARKDEVLDLMLETAAGAIDQIDNFERESEASPSIAFKAFAKVDLDHTCRDLAALIDPERALSITFPGAFVFTDAGVLTTALQALLEIVTCRASSYIHISVIPDPRRPRLLQLRIAFDPEENAIPEIDPAWIRAAVEAHGGALRVERGHSAEIGPCDIVDLSLPGKILPPAGRGNGARAVNQRRTDPATG